MGTESPHQAITADAGATRIETQDQIDRERAIEAERASAEEWRTRARAMTDAELMELLGELFREQWEAECSHTRFVRYRAWGIVHAEYRRRGQEREMPPIPEPLSVPCYVERQDRRRFDETLDRIIPGPLGVLLTPVKGYVQVARFVVVPGAELNTPVLGQSKLTAAVFLAIPPAVGYWTYRRKNSLLWGAGAAVGTIYGIALAGLGLFAYALSGQGSPRY